MKISLIKPIEKACFYIADGIIYNVNHEFLQLIGYKHEDIVGKSLKELSILLKNDFQKCFGDIEGEENLYIFTKKNSARDVIVNCEFLLNSNKKVYYVEENMNSDLKSLLRSVDRMDINTDESLAIYSYPQCIELYSNNNYSKSLSLMDIKEENYIGRFPEFSPYLSHLIKSGQSFHDYKVEVAGFNGKKPIGM